VLAPQGVRAVAVDKEYLVGPDRLVTPAGEIGRSVAPNSRRVRLPVSGAAGTAVPLASFDVLGAGDEFGSRESERGGQPSEAVVIWIALARLDVGDPTLVQV
jgi:hypothetical protein